MKLSIKIELTKDHWYLWTRKGKQHIIKRRWWRHSITSFPGDQLIDLTEVFDTEPYIEKKFRVLTRENKDE